MEGLRAQLEGVKGELAPWEAQMAEVQARIDVAAAEAELLVKQAEDAKQRFEDAQVRLGRGRDVGPARAFLAKDRPCLHAAAPDSASRHCSYPPPCSAHRPPQVSLRAAQESAANRSGQIKEMEASVEQYRCGCGGKVGEGWRGAAMGPGALSSRRAACG